MLGNVVGHFQGDCIAALVVVRLGEQTLCRQEYREKMVFKVPLVGKKVRNNLPYRRICRRVNRGG